MTSRREFLCGSMLAGLAHAAPAKMPNIVLILADDLGYGDVGVYNAESKIPTPNLDKLAGEGVRFVDAHAPSAVCSPTRYGILTGRYPWRSDLKSGVLWPYDRPLIEKNRLTLPAMLKRQGYHTACIGKWHLGFDWPSSDGTKVNDLVPIGEQQRLIRDEWARKVDFARPIGEGPNSRGFDYYFGVDLPNFPPYTFMENDRIVTQPTGVKPQKWFGWPGAMAPGWRLEGVMPEITRRAVKHVRERAAKGSPYFLYFPLTAPHTPIAPDAPFVGKSKAGSYGDFVHQVDWTVGQVMDAVRKSGQAGNTIVIFTSDNGPENLTYPLYPEYGHSSAGEWRGAKRMLWEGGHRVPFLAWGPGRVPVGKIENETICLTDLMATMAAMTGAKLPNDAAEDSYDVSAALFRRKRTRAIREATVLAAMNGELAVRQGDWMLVESRNGGGGTAEPEWWRERHKAQPCAEPAALYNLKDNPRETQSVYLQNPQRVQQMRALLERYAATGRSVPVRN